MKTLKQTVLLWWIAGVKALLFSLVLLGTSWLTALNKLDWSTLQWDDQRNILIGMLVSWGTGMMMFLDKSAGEVSHGKIPGLSEVDDEPPKP